MQTRKVNVFVGLFVLLGAAALVFLALQAGNLASFQRGETYEVSAKFDNIGGLKPRAPVKSAGVVVGRVGDIGFDDQTFQAVVRLQLDKRYAFPKDTSAAILTSGLLGEQYVGLNAGGDPDNLAPGERISSTQSAIVLESLISQFLFKSAADAGGKKEDAK
ncbi:outer membrane lipid asymmetry maintenance protein MlaD [Derxia gummosa]|uniref:Outer membrane lipid asymmetry maintenance protein MlaD n=1 Tax=Derxia gummosa DSM 723 TaxID=1121388 RepID=A0A8B6X5P2_9BURK|nr:outer membrane lipid asymmetry maintenance protein MlaD [Derxia gummosa]